jgi:hypothetical protein
MPLPRRASGTGPAAGPDVRGLHPAEHRVGPAGRKPAVDGCVDRQHPPELICGRARVAAAADFCRQHPVGSLT